MDSVEAMCQLNSITDMIFRYIIEGGIILWGLFMLIMFVGLFLIGQYIWSDIFESMRN